MRQARIRHRRLRTFFGGDRHGIGPGLVDAAFASLATFLTGLFAVRVLDPAALGAYALGYQALFLVGILPAYLILTPAEVAVIAGPVDRRLDHLRRSVALGAPVALAAAIASALWIVVAPPQIGFDTIRALAVTVVATAFLSPIQDHVRHMLHAGGRSWKAATVSVVQFVSAVLGIGALTALDVAPAWVPFGALAFANLVSLMYGLVAARPAGSVPPSDRLRFGDLVAAGRWIFAGAIFGPVASFAAAAIVSRLAGPEALGYAEGARIVAQPVWVLAVGLSFVLGPRSMEAGRVGDRQRAREISRTFSAAVWAVGLGTMAWFGVPWSLNPLPQLLPTAYVVGWLTLLTLLAQTVNGLNFPQRSELLGGRREAALTKTEAAMCGTRIVVASTAPVTHAFALPLAFLTVGVLRAQIYRWLTARLYGEPSREPRGSAVSSQ